MKSKRVLCLVLILMLQAVVTAYLATILAAASPNRLFATFAGQGIVEIDPVSGAVLNTFAAPVNLGVSDGA